MVTLARAFMFLLILAPIAFFTAHADPQVYTTAPSSQDFVQRLTELCPAGTLYSHTRALTMEQIAWTVQELDYVARELNQSLLTDRQKFVTMEAINACYQWYRTELHHRRQRHQR